MICVRHKENEAVAILDGNSICAKCYNQEMKQREEMSFYNPCANPTLDWLREKGVIRRPEK